MWKPTTLTGAPGDRRDNFVIQNKVPRKERTEAGKSSPALQKFSRNLRRAVQQQGARNVGNFYGKPLDRSVEWSTENRVGSSGRQGTSRKHYEDQEVSGNIRTAKDKIVAVAAVFDGHGGTSVSAHLGKHFLGEMARQFSERSFDLPADVLSGYRETFNCLHNTAPQGYVGSTAVTAAVTDRFLVVANIGDSRAVLIRKNTAIQLSFDQKPDHPDIKRLIEKNRPGERGGRVFGGRGDLRVNGMLGTGRAIGDSSIGNVSHRPKISAIPRSQEDEYLILACDGLWDVLSPESTHDQLKLAIAQVDQLDSNQTQQERLTMIAASLAATAVRRGSRDDITVSIVDLRLHLTDRL